MTLRAQRYRDSALPSRLRTYHPARRTTRRGGSIISLKQRYNRVGPYRYDSGEGNQRTAFAHLP